jgi:hypothetical protein
MPVEESIHWKPLRDPHYVVASLQPSDGGRRKIFVRQQVLARVETLVRVHAAPYRRATAWPVLSMLRDRLDYLVIESIRITTSLDESEMAAKVAEALADRAKEHHAHFLDPPRIACTCLAGIAECTPLRPPSLTTAVTSRYSASRGR